MTICKGQFCINPFFLQAFSWHALICLSLWRKDMCALMQWEISQCLKISCPAGVHSVILGLYWKAVIWLKSVGYKYLCTQMNWNFLGSFLLAVLHSWVGNLFIDAFISMGCLIKLADFPSIQKRETFIF